MANCDLLHVIAIAISITVLAAVIENTLTATPKGKWVHSKSFREVFTIQVAIDRCVRDPKLAGQQQLGLEST